MKFAASLVLALVVGCSSKPTPSASTWGPEEYAAEGIAIENAWTDEDHARAATVLARVTQGHRERLPRFRDPGSGAVFAKLIEPLPDPPGLPIADRVGAHVERFTATNAISKLYADNLLTPPREWIELMGAELREAAILVVASERLLDSLAPDDPSRAVRVDGLARMKVGFGGMLLGGVMVADNQTVPMDDRVAMMQHITAALPVLLPAVPAEVQTRIRDYLQRLEEALPEGELRASVRAANLALPAR